MHIVIRKIEKKYYQETIETIIDSIKGSFPKVRPAGLTDYFCDKYTYQRFKKWASEATIFIAVDKDQDSVVGVIGLKEDKLRTFYVKTNYQRKGIGRLLYQRLENEAKKKI